MYIKFVHLYVYFEDKNKKQYTKYKCLHKIRCQQMPLDLNVCFKYLGNISTTFKIHVILVLISDSRIRVH